MRVRRCAVVWLEPRELATFQLDDLLAGGTGVVSRLAWFAHAPHLGAAIEIDQAHVALLGAVGPVDWVGRDMLEARFGVEAVAALLAMQLLLQEPGVQEQALADARFRAQGWHPPAAVAHMAARWEAIDGPAGMAEQGLDSNEGLLQQHGLPPPPESPVPEGAPLHVLPRPARDGFDALLDARITCRNYDPQASIPLEVFSGIMARTFGRRGSGQPAPGFEVIKRTSPSGGALHPVECFLIVQRVQGLAPGLYRYRAAEHALLAVAPQVAAPVVGDVGTRALPTGEAATAWSGESLRAFAQIAVAGQTFFADAAVLCVLAPRFHRNFWKYRNHAKAYRVCVLDAGHLSQTLQLCATQAGLGPFVTSAINEVDLERAFGMIHYEQSPLLVCGFGPRAGTLVESEFDPNRRVWPR
ncbi:MAG: putative peptide maturation dehydrogenase [Stenotrophomonas sp.]|jgi:putative peptide maturation dehydrogenase|nr:putative peptide maturation dehydrogenase [Xanthomonadales bacterium]MBN8767795.1 putative peptide maturation dehydrogenase [Stenotrophomonas sp.]